jgi:hypothetical protein
MSIKNLQMWEDGKNIFLFCQIVGFFDSMKIRILLEFDELPNKMNPK